MPPNLERKLFNELSERFSARDRTLIKKAIKYSKTQTEKQNFENPSDAVKHLLRSAINAVRLGLGPVPTVAILLHYVGDFEAVKKEIEKEFGSEVTKIIIEFVKYEEIEHTNPVLARKVFVSMSKDIQFVLLRIAHVLEDLRRIDQLPVERRATVLKDVKELYIPIATKLGMFSAKSNMEDMLFKETDPDIYAELSGKMKLRKARYLEKINKIKEIIKNELEKAGIDTKVRGRTKHIYSTYCKMKRKQVSFEGIYDLIGLRIVTGSVKDCYEALGIVHSLWRPILDEFDDYIAKPKENGYQSIHTAVVSSDGGVIEIQIRTGEMDAVAEIGGAAHWKYKGQKIARQDRKLTWLKQLVEWQKEYKQMFVGSAKADFFENDVFVITPKDEIVELPMGATALDFAYSIHSDLGNKCSKIKVGGKFVPFDYLLQNGDRVEVFISEKQKPKRNWLNFVKTEKARSLLMKKLNIKLPIKTIAVKERKPKHALELNENDKRLRFAKCCAPQPGGEIVGYLTTKRKITVHKVGCKEAKKLQKQIKISILGWGDKKAGGSVYTLGVTAKDKIGVLSKILHSISAQNAMLISTGAKTTPSNMIHCELGVKTTGTRSPESIIRSIKAIEGVIKVEKI